MHSIYCCKERRCISSISSLTDTSIHLKSLSQHIKISIFFYKKLIFMIVIIKWNCFCHDDDDDMSFLSTKKKHTRTVYTRPRKNFLTATFSVVVSFGRLSSFIVFVCQYMFTFIANASTPLSWKIIVNVTAIFVCMYRQKKLRIIQFDAIMQTVIIVIVVKISESNINDTHTHKHTHDLALKIYFKIVPSHLIFVALLYCTWKHFQHFQRIGHL